MSLQIESERSDDIPLIVYWLEQMQIQSIVDEHCPPLHGNWQGLSYGQLVMVLLVYMITQSDHRLCAVEPWVKAHHRTLEGASGWRIAEHDTSDDRLALVLERLGQHPEVQVKIENDLGQHLIEAYALPTEVARVDTTSFSVYHHPASEEAEAASVIQYGRSKDHRPDLRQYRYEVSTIDPLGLPIASQVLPGNETDNSIYVRSWQRLGEAIGHRTFVMIGDCKASALATRAQIHQQGGIYCVPLAQTGHTPAILKHWVLTPPTEKAWIRLPQQAKDEEPIGVGFEMVLGKRWQAPDNHWITWEERQLVVHSFDVAHTELKTFNRRIEKVETALAKLAAKPTANACELEKAAMAVLKRHRLTDCFEIQVRPSSLTVSGAKASSAPCVNGEAPPSFLLHYQQSPDAIEQAQLLMGWRIYVTNAARKRLSLPQSLGYYRGQWSLENGFHRHKRGHLPALPIYFRNDDRIRGLMFVLSMALRLFCLMEYVVRSTLKATDSKVAGLYDGNPKRTTKRPSTESLLKAFDNITLYLLPDESTHITPLNALQRHLLALMNVPESIYGFT